MNKDNLKKALECRAKMKPPFDCENCEYLDRSDDWGTCDAKKLGADALELIHELESMNVSASGNGTAIGTVRGGLVIQHAKEIHNVEHIDELKL